MQLNSHLSVLVHEVAKHYGAKPAITFRNFGSLKWKSVVEPILDTCQAGLQRLVEFGRKTA